MVWGWPQHNVPDSNKTGRHLTTTWWFNREGIAHSRQRKQTKPNSTVTTMLRGVVEEDGFLVSSQTLFLLSIKRIMKQIEWISQFMIWEQIYTCTYIYIKYIQMYIWEYSIWKFTGNYFSYFYFFCESFSCTVFCFHFAILWVWKMFLLSL